MNNNLNMGTEKINKLFLAFVIPSVLAMLATTTAGVVDSYFIGNYIGKSGVGAITLVMPFMNIFGAVSSMVVSGGMVLAGHALGRGDKKESNNLFNVSLWLSVITTLIIVVLLLFFGEYLVYNVLHAEGATALNALDYLMTINFFFIFYALSFHFNFFLKLDGFPSTIVRVTTFGVIINIVLDYFLIGFLGYGVRGAAIATGMSQLIPTLIFVWFTIKKSNWSFVIPHFRFIDIRTIFFNGSSELFTMGSVGITGYIYNMMITKYIGLDGIASYGIAMQSFSIATMLFYGISDGIQSIISYNYGARKLERVKSIRNRAYLTSFTIGVLFSFAFYFYGYEIAGIFIKDPLIQSISSGILGFLSVAVLLCGININTVTYYTALGQPVKSGILALSRSLIFLLVGLAIFPLIDSEMGIWVPLVFKDLITILIVVFFLRTSPFGNNNLDEENEKFDELKPVVE